MAVWSTKFINDLPDSSFLYIKPGGKKDETGRTAPRTNRMFPYKDADGKVDLPHVRNALARIPRADIAAAIKARLTEKARAILKRTTEAELWSYIRLSEPYARNSDLPKGVRGALPAGAQTIYRKAFNAALKQYDGDETRAAKVAWAAVKNKYRKSGDKWILKESDMGTQIYRRVSEAIFQLKVDKLKLDVEHRRLPDPKPTAESEEKPATETMQESYALPVETLSEVAALEQGGERVLRGCTFIRAGLNVPQTRRWPAELLEANTALFSDALCFIDHPGEGQPRSLRALAGHTRNAHWDKATNSVIGDIQLLDNEAADYVVSLFSNDTIRNSGAVGLSVLWEGGTFEADFEEYGDKTIQVPTKLGGKCQVDFVANPTAHGQVGTL